MFRKNLSLIILIATAALTTLGCGSRLSSGTLKSAHVKAWFFPSSSADSFNSGSSVTGPKVVFNNNGQGVMVWLSDGLHKSLYQDGRWSASEEVAAAAASPNSPDVAMDESGNIVIVWRQADGSDHHVYKSEFRNGVWTHPSGPTDHISPSGGTSSHSSNCIPRVEMDSSGNTIVAWVQSSNGSNARSYKSEFRNGAWIHPGLNDYFSPDGPDPATTLSEAPHIAMNDSGEALIAWKQDSGSTDSIFKSDYRNGAWIHPMDINDSITSAADGTFPTSPGIEVHSKDVGSGLVLWIQRNPSNRLQIFHAERVSGVWSAPTSLTDLLGVDAGLNITNYRMATDASGQKILAWVRTNGSGNQDVLRADYRNQAWGTPQLISEDVSLTVSTSLQLGMSADGSAAVIWGYGDFSDSSFFRSHYVSGQWSTAIDFSSLIKKAGRFVYSNDGQFAMNDSGEILSTWIEYGGGKSYLMKAEYR